MPDAAPAPPFARVPEHVPVYAPRFAPVLEPVPVYAPPFAPVPEHVREPVPVPALPSPPRAKRVQMMKILYRSKKFLVFVSFCATLYGAAY